MKKLISLILSVLCVLSVLGAPFAAFAEEYAGEEAVVMNPLYSGEEIKMPVLASKATQESESKKIGDDTFYSDGKQFYIKIRNSLEKHRSSFTVNYISTSNFTSLFSVLSLRDFLNNLFLYSTEDELSASSTDGDYLRWLVSSMSFDDLKQVKYQNGKYYYKIKMTVGYYTTSAQEKKTDAAIGKIVNGINTARLSDYEVVKRVEDIICSGTSYCYDALEEPYDNTYAFTAYGALVKGSCVCQGYAAAFYRICRELGYNVRLVNSDPDRGCHAWNIIELDGKYYFIDTTWDDQIIDEELTGHSQYEYFLTDYTAVQSGDSTNHEHRLDSRYYNTKYFNDNYKSKFATESYDSENEKLFSQYRIALSEGSFAYDGTAHKPTVTVTKADGTVLTQGTDYTLSYSDNKSTGAARVTVKGKGDYDDTKAYRQFFVVPAKMSALSLDGARESKAISFRWKKVSSASGYVIQRYKGGKWVNVKATTSTSATVFGLSPANTYRFRIRAYKTVYRRNHYGDPSSEFKTATRPGKVYGVSVKAGSGRATVSWTQRKASYYIIEYSTKRNMSGAKKVRVSSSISKKTVKGLSRYRKYYFRIKAYYNYTNSSGKARRVSSVYSAKKSAWIG